MTFFTSLRNNPSWRTDYALVHLLQKEGKAFSLTENLEWIYRNPTLAPMQLCHLPGFHSLFLSVYSISLHSLFFIIKGFVSLCFFLLKSRVIISLSKTIKPWMWLRVCVLKDGELRCTNGGFFRLYFRVGNCKKEQLVI